MSLIKATDTGSVDLGRLRCLHKFANGELKTALEKLVKNYVDRPDPDPYTRCDASQRAADTLWAFMDLVDTPECERVPKQLFDAGVTDDVNQPVDFDDIKSDQFLREWLDKGNDAHSELPQSSFAAAIARLPDWSRQKYLIESVKTDSITPRQIYKCMKDPQCLNDLMHLMKWKVPGIQSDTLNLLRGFNLFTGLGLQAGLKKLIRSFRIPDHMASIYREEAYAIEAETQLAFMRLFKKLPHERTRLELCRAGVIDKANTDVDLSRIRTNEFLRGWLDERDSTRDEFLREWREKRRSISGETPLQIKRAEAGASKAANQSTFATILSTLPGGSPQHELMHGIQTNNITPYKIWESIKDPACLQALTFFMNEQYQREASVTLNMVSSLNTFAKGNVQEALEKLLRNYTNGNDPSSEIGRKLSADTANAQLAFMEIIGRHPDLRKTEDLCHAKIFTGNDTDANLDYLKSDEFLLEWLEKGGNARKTRKVDDLVYSNPAWDFVSRKMEEWNREQEQLLSNKSDSISDRIPGPSFYSFAPLPRVGKDTQNFLNKVKNWELSLKEISEIIDADLHGSNNGKKFLEPLRNLVKSGNVAPQYPLLRSLGAMMELFSGDLHGALFNLVRNPAMRKNGNRMTPNQQIGFTHVVSLPEHRRTEKMLFDIGVTTTPNLGYDELKLFNSKDFLVNWLSSESGDLMEVMETRLKEPILSKINWKYANFVDIEISYKDFRGCDFEGANFDGAYIRKCGFQDVRNWRGATIYGGGIEDCKDINNRREPYNDEALQKRLEQRGLRFDK